MLKFELKTCFFGNIIIWLMKAFIGLLLGSHVNLNSINIYYYLSEERKNQISISFFNIFQLQLIQIGTFIHHSKSIILWPLQCCDKWLTLDIGIGSVYSHVDRLIYLLVMMGMMMRMIIRQYDNSNEDNGLGNKRMLHEPFNDTLFLTLFICSMILNRQNSSINWHKSFSC